MKLQFRVVGWRSRLGMAAGVGLVVAIQGCAAPATGMAPSAADPIEPWNRKVYAFNEGLDQAVIKPVATGYANVMPTMARTGVTNFFNNFKDAWSAVNSLLQGKVGDGLSGAMRVTTNTILGVGGLMDWATELRMDRYNEDFGQTLGAWGVGAGPYVVWPLLGPSSVRDSFGLPLDIAATPGAWTNDTGAALGVSTLNLINVRANVMNATGLLDDVVLDKYTFVRDGYLQRRRSLVYDGNPPPVPEAAEPVVPSVAPSVLR